MYYNNGWEATNVIKVDNTGKVGINLSTGSPPAYNLDVNGTVSIAGGSQFNDDVRINSSGTLTIVDLGLTGATRNVVVNQFGDLEATTLTTAYTLPMATSTSLGGIKVGNGLSVDAAGELSVDPNGITFPWTVEATGEAHRNSNIGIGDFTLTSILPFCI